ncbi:MAG: DUF4013 domain-containing protein [Chloroflexi bacterium]|nr:MAG: DUF4013 domain-containing protein [Chloroflexota bacterium]TME15295.1 MAG: DUF4013 domain-containing protein [Chloroflexota bacterium]TME16048.1 MAG: DUF4013 domain-containing protein [Chloroflexota bacterium]
MPDIGEILGWPFKDPRWPSRLLLTGLLWLALSVTVVGAPIAAVGLNGWMLAALDNLRAGRTELPAPGFRNWGRGLRVFLVLLIYYVALAAIAGVPIGAGLLVGLRGTNSIGAGLLTVFGQSLLLLGSTVLAVLTPAIVVLTERAGWSGGLNVLNLWRTASVRPSLTLIAGLIALLALDIISPLGALACLVGVALTTPYAFAVLAAAVSAYERALLSDR